MGSLFICGRSLCGVSVGQWEALSGVSVGLWRALCKVSVGVWEVSVWGHCGSVKGPSLGSVWICLGLCVGFLGALCWIIVGIWEVPIWGQCGSDPLFEGDPPLLCFLHLTAGEGQGPLHVWFLAVLSVSLLCHCSRQAP